jgi:hypothetical protein
MKDTTFSSKAYGTHEYKDLTIEGRVQFDVYMALQRDHKLSSYTLNAVRAAQLSSIHLQYVLRTMMAAISWTAWPEGLARCVHYMRCISAAAPRWLVLQTCSSIVWRCNSNNLAKPSSAAQQPPGCAIGPAAVRMHVPVPKAMERSVMTSMSRWLLGLTC